MIKKRLKKQYNKTIQKLVNFDEVIKEETKEHNSNWPEISDHPYRILISGVPGPPKTNSLLNLIKQWTDTD